MFSLSLESTDRIAAAGACSYGMFWIIAFGGAILDRKNFRPDMIFYFAAGCALVYFFSGILALCRVKGSTRLLQITTAIVTVLILAAFCILFPKQSIIGRGMLIAFGQLQTIYAVCVCALLRHSPEELSTE